MKIKKFLASLNADCETFHAYPLPGRAGVVLVRDDNDSCPAVALSQDDSHTSDVVYMDVNDLRKVAKLFNELAFLLEEREEAERVANERIGG